MNNNSIDINSIIKRNDELLFSEMDGEVVMLSIQNSEYYGMNPIGSRIWEAIEEPIKVKDLINQLLTEYEVDENECEQDVLSYLSELKKKDVILLVENE